MVQESILSSRSHLCIGFSFFYSKSHAHTYRYQSYKKQISPNTLGSNALDFFWPSASCCQSFSQSTITSNTFCNPLWISVHSWILLWIWYTAFGFSWYVSLCKMRWKDLFPCQIINIKNLAEFWWKKLVESPKQSSSSVQLGKSWQDKNNFRADRKTEIFFVGGFHARRQNSSLYSHKHSAPFQNRLSKWIAWWYRMVSEKGSCDVFFPFHLDLDLKKVVLLIYKAVQSDLCW